MTGNNEDSVTLTPYEGKYVCKLQVRARAKGKSIELNVPTMLRKTAETRAKDLIKTDYFLADVLPYLKKAGHNVMLSDVRIGRVTSGKPPFFGTASVVPDNVTLSELYLSWFVFKEGESCYLASLGDRLAFLNSDFYSKLGSRNLSSILGKGSSLVQQDMIGFSHFVYNDLDLEDKLVLLEGKGNHISLTKPTPDDVELYASRQLKNAMNRSS